MATTGVLLAIGCTEEVVVVGGGGPEGTLALPTAVAPPPPPAPGPAPGTDAGRAGNDAAVPPPRDASVPVPDAAQPDSALPVDASIPDTSTGGTTPVRDEVVISEVMYDPSTTEPDTEWIELANVTASAKTLNGLTLTTPGGGTFTFPASPAITLGAGEYKVIARNRVAAIAALVPAASILTEYGIALGSLSNGTTGGVSLSNGATVIARAPYAGFFASPQGASIQLKTLTFAAAGTAASWCVSPTAFAVTADKGTPGAPSDCP